MVFVARYLARNKEKEIIFKESLLQLWLPVSLVLILILPANFSTPAIIFAMILVIVFIGGYPLKYISFILVAGILAFTFFILIVKQRALLKVILKVSLLLLLLLLQRCTETA